MFTSIKNTFTLNISDNEYYARGYYFECYLLQFSEAGRKKKADLEKCLKHLCLKSYIVTVGGNEYCPGIEGSIVSCTFYFAAF